MEKPTGIMPAVRHLKDFEKALMSKYRWIVLLETRLVQLQQLVKYAKREDKKILIHMDLIQGLKADEHGIEFIARHVKPDGIISTRGTVIESAKKHQLLAIQRLFLLDSLSIDSNVRLSGRSKADYIEVLPGTMPEVIQRIQGETDIPIIAGGLLTSKEQIEEAFSAGAVGVTTSSTALW